MGKHVQNKGSTSGRRAGKPAAGSNRALDDALTAAVLPLRDSLTFVFEEFTHEDWEQVRSRLPEEYRQLTDQPLKERAVRLRKRGILRSEEEQEMARRLGEAKKAVRAYWSGDTSLDELTDLLKKLKPGASATDEEHFDEEGPAVDEHAMRALTLKPEFAELVASGEKLVENRSWRANVEGQRIAIHRGGGDGGIVAVATAALIVPYEEDVGQLPEDVLDVIAQQEDAGHVCGPLCWILKDVQRVEPPIPCKGKLGLWIPDPEVQAQLKARGLRREATGPARP